MGIRADGEVTEYCKICTGILGHDFGRHSRFSDEEANKWFEEIEERKKQLLMEGII